jgi:hypothetical protein
MNDRDDFLSRWSRRKREAGKPPAPEEESVKEQSAETAALPDVEAEKSAQPDLPPGKEKKDEPAFDLTKLPSIESITAETDIRPFLAAGVPASLRQAALRRAWSADPAIREFIGIAENQWDFTPGGNAPGFDFSTPSEEIRRAVAQMFTGSSSAEKQRPRDESGFDIEPEPVEPLPEAEREQDQIAVSSESEEQDTVTNAAELPSSSDELPVSTARERDVASQNDDATQNEKPKFVGRRSHGGAMPK